MYYLYGYCKPASESGVRKKARTKRCISESGGNGDDTVSVTSNDAERIGQELKRCFLEVCFLFEL